MGHIDVLLNKRLKSFLLDTKKLTFQGVKSFSVYNPSSSFFHNGKEYIFGRVEKKERKTDSWVILFKKKGHLWEPEYNFKHLRLEDPFITFIHEYFIFGGTEVKKNLFSKKVKFRTVFYLGKDVFSLKRFFDGPWGMKDIRLVELSTGEIGVFTRPMKGDFKRGRIGFVIVPTLKELSIEKIINAPLIDIPFSDNEWGGVNDAICLDKNTIGVLAHFACTKEGLEDKFYYPISFLYSIKGKKIKKTRILFTRDDLPWGDAKTSSLYHVIFPGGIQRNNEDFVIFVGVSDYESYRITLKNPFIS